MVISDYCMFGKIVLMSILLVSCSKKKEFDQIKVVGHAATGLEILNSVYHDNSEEAVEMALSIEGCDEGGEQAQE